MKHLNVPQSGSQADTVASRNRFGQYYRTRAMPTNTNTDAQVAARARFAQLSQAWRTEQSDDQAAWDAYAASHPRVDSLGQTIILTGHQMYIALNTLTLLAGETVQHNPPADLAIAAPTIDDSGVALGDLTYAVTGVSNGDKVFWYAARPQSAGVSFVSDYRLMMVQTIGATGPYEADLDGPFNAKFGPPVGGQFVWVQAFVWRGGQAGAVATKNTALV